MSRILLVLVQTVWGATAGDPPKMGKASVARDPEPRLVQVAPAHVI